MPFNPPRPGYNSHTSIAKRPGEDLYQALGREEDGLCTMMLLDEKIARAIRASLIAQTWKAICENKRVIWPGLVTFTPYTRKARTGRNPRTGATINIPEAKSVKIRSAYAFNRELN